VKFLARQVAASNLGVRTVRGEVGPRSKSTGHPASIEIKYHAIARVPLRSAEGKP